MIIKTLGRDELREAAALSDRVFGTDGEPFMRDAFPAIFSGAYEGSCGLYEDGKLVSFMGLVPHQLRIGKASLPLYALGSVCTDSDYRGRGYARKLLEHVFRHMEAGGSLLFVSGGGKLYTSNGCRRFGATRQFRMTAGTDLEEGGLQFRDALERDRFHIHRLFEQSEVRYGRSLYEMGALLQAKALAGIYKLRQRVIVATRGGELVAYAVLAVKGDANSESNHPPFMVEGGGEAHGLEQLLRYAVNEGVAHELHVFAPWQERELIERLHRFPSTMEHHSGTVKVVNYERFWKALTPYLLDKCAEAFRKVQVINASDRGTDKPASIQIRNDAPVELDHDEWTALLFGTEPTLSDRLVRHRALLEELFPIPLPYPSGLQFV